MDAMELPLPANTVVSKLLKPEGLGCGARDSASDVAIIRNLSTAYCSFTGDTASSHHHLEQSSVATGRESDETCTLPVSECANSVTYLPHTHLSLSKSVCKRLQQSMEKLTSGNACSKRRRIKKLEEYSKLVRSDDNKIASGRTSSGFTWLKTAGCSAIGSDVYVVENGELYSCCQNCPYDHCRQCYTGKCPIKSDIDHSTKHLGELSLSELLDGSYKILNVHPDREKNATNPNGSILSSVRKACSVLSLGRVLKSGNDYVQIASNSSKEKVSNVQMTSYAIKEKVSNLLIPKSCLANLGGGENLADVASLEKDSCRMLGDLECLCDIGSVLYKPNVILDLLSLPPAMDLSSLLLETPARPAYSGVQTFQSARLPPFPWSLSYGGSFKVNVDAGKFSIDRSVYEGKWVRMESDTTTRGNNGDGCFSDMTFTNYDHNPVQQTKYGLCKTAKISPVFIRSHGGKGDPSRAVIFLKSCSSEKSISKSTTSVNQSCTLLKLNLPERCPSSSSDGDLLLGKGRIGQAINHNVDDRGPSSSDRPDFESEGAHSGLRESSCRRRDGYQFLFSESTSTTCDQSQCHLPVPGSLNEVQHSPRLLEAAEILCGLANCYSNDVMGEQDPNSGELKWCPSKPSLQNATKVWKSRPWGESLMQRAPIKTSLDTGRLLHITSSSAQRKPRKEKTIARQKILNMEEN